MGTYMYTFSKPWQYTGYTLIRRHSHASCTAITLFNRQAYTNMCMYVADTSYIRQKYVTHALSMSYQYAPYAVHLHASVLDLGVAYLQRIQRLPNVCLTYNPYIGVLQYLFNIFKSNFLPRCMSAYASVCHCASNIYNLCLTYTSVCQRMPAYE